MDELLEYSQELDVALYDLDYYMEATDIVYDLSVFIAKILEALIDFFKKVEESIAKKVYELKLHHQLRQLKKDYANNRAEFIKAMSGKKPTFFDMVAFKKEANDYIKAANDAITKIDSSFRVHNVNDRVKRDAEFIEKLTKKYEEKLNDKDRFIKAASSWDEAIDKYIYNIEHYKDEMKSIEDKTKKVYQLSKDYLKYDNEENKELVAKAAAARKSRMDFAHGAKITTMKFAGYFLMSQSVGVITSVGRAFKSNSPVDAVEHMAAAGGRAAVSGIGYSIVRHAEKLDRDHKNGK